MHAHFLSVVNHPQPIFADAMLAFSSTPCWRS